MNFLHIIPSDIYTQIYKYIYDDCMKDIVRLYNDKRNNKYKDKLIRKIMNDDIWIHYTSLDLFNHVSLGIIGNADAIYGNADDVDGDLLDEEMYYLTKITKYNFRKYHYNILISELPEEFKNATCIRMTLLNDDNDIIDIVPLYYLFKDFITTWIELIYYTNKLLKEFLMVNNLQMELFSLYRFDTVIENGYLIIVPYFEEQIIFI